MVARCTSLTALAALAFAVSPTAAAPPSRTEPAIEAAFRQESYPPQGVASLRFFKPARGVIVQVFRSGPERVHTRRADVLNGVPVTRRRWLGRRDAGSTAPVPVGRWPSGLYFARLTSSAGLVGYAPFVVRPPTLGGHPVAVVLPTQTWQAYNFRDDDGDGTPDTWYASARIATVRLFRPMLYRGVPYRFRHYDLP